MKIKANLFINSNGNLRVTKKDTSAYAHELAVQLIIDVPDVFFKRPMPRVELSIPEEFLISPDKEIAVKWVSKDIAEALKIEVASVEDALGSVVKEQLGEE